MKSHRSSDTRRGFAWAAQLILVTTLPCTAFAELTVRDGLGLWLDAQRLAASMPAEDPTIAQPIASWSDAADATSAFEQTRPDMQPHLVRIGDDAVVRFDGVDDHLRSVGGPRQTDQLTVLVVAAPHANFGGFSGLIAANAADRTDYQSGFNLDLGVAQTERFDVLNAEGNGFSGASDLLDVGVPFGTLHTVTLTVDAAARLVRVRLDGKPVGQREWTPGPISLSEFTLGARHFPESPAIRCMLQGDIAEALVFDRALSGPELESVESYLITKHGALAERLLRQVDGDPDVDQVPLVRVADPPAIQMLVPGFEVREIPVELTNVNNVRFRPDGTLVTLGYNGDIHLLRDTDGDGLEDDAKRFWTNPGSLRGPIGMELTPPGYPHGQGVFTPSKGKLSLIVDKDGDDVADEEIVVASGWKEITQNVDATGIAIDQDGSLYFGLGTADYSNAYLIDESGHAKYDLSSDRGTVQRVSPDFKTRETICTGIRFPIAFAFHSNGDLFCSEQEGATWLANGNPFDELLHIEPDKHYGFPPRHPVHNPGVLDEPSVFDYGPQHQSTCGMVFNRPLGDGRPFGPSWWVGQAIVCGESRGKLWRTLLTKTPAGYVADTQLLACLQMLTVDACVAPDGDLVVACHSGPPDWGTGPTGIGKLYRIHMHQPDIARPANVWANSDREIQIAFDREIDPASFQGIAQAIEIRAGDFVRAGDEFETLSPPYAVVKRQSDGLRRKLQVRGMALSNDRRNLLLQTDPMRWNTHYAITIPYNAPLGNRDDADDAIRQHPRIDVDFSVSGIRADFVAGEDANATAGQSDWQGWLPHVDWGVTSDVTRHSASHDEFRSRVAGGGEVTLRTKIDLKDILRPAVQPGSSLDYQWPDEVVTLHLQSSQPYRLTVAGRSADVTADAKGRFGSEVEVTGGDVSAVPVEIRFAIEAGKTPDWTIAVSTNEDSTKRALPLRRFFLPWAADRDAAGSLSAPVSIAELAGGSWGRGRRVFHSEAASCFKCHAIHGPGEIIGPDLSNLIHRDYASVLRDIKNPSYAINPDHLGQIVLMQDGNVLTGVLRTENHQLLLSDSAGKVTRIDPDEIELIKPSEVSVMPQGLDEKLTPDQLRDLMTFLLTPPPHMPLDSPLEAPPVRTRAEVAQVLAGSQPMPDDRPMLQIVLVAGEKDHGPGEHDYPAWQVQWGQLLSAADQVTVQTAWDFPTDQQLAQADVCVFFQKGAWDDSRQAKMDAYFDRGGGAVYLHWAVNGEDRVADFSQRIGLASEGGKIGYRHGPLSLQVHNTDHPIMRNIESLELYDESYWRLTGDVRNVTLFASSVEDGQARPQLWAYQPGRGRVFVSIPGHYNWTFDDPIFRTVLLRGMAWTARQNVDRFNELVPLGARIAR